MRVPSLAVLVLLAFLASGCATFVPHKRANLAPFAENAVSVAADVEYGLVQTRTIYTRPYVDGPAVSRYVSQWQGIRHILRHIVAYSVEIVTISESSMSEIEQARALAKYIDALGRPVVESRQGDVRFTSGQFDSLVARIASQKKYLDALSAAQPVVDEVGRIAADTLDALKGSLDLARDEVAERIRAEHAAVLSYGDALREAQTRTFRSMTLMSRARRGEQGALDSLFPGDPQLSELTRDPASPTLEELHAVEKRLLDRLAMFKALRGEMAPELEQQGREMKELDDLAFAGRTSILKAAGAVEIWRRSHQTMAAGITDPAAIDLFGIARSAVGKVAPVP